MKPQENNIKNWNKKWVFLVYLRKPKEYLDIRFSKQKFWNILRHTTILYASKKIKTIQINQFQGKWRKKNSNNDF